MVMLMTLLKIEDNSKNKKEEFTVISTLTERIADKTLEQLEKEDIFIFPELLKDSEDLSKEQLILNSKNNDYYSGNVTGFLGLNQERLIIQSRFTKDDKDDYFFQYLLAKVFETPAVLELDSDANQDDKIYNMLLFLFPFYLKIAMRKGPYKTYIKREQNDGNIKGTIDIARHIKMNTPFVGRIAYNQREFSYDNYLTELIRHTIEYIKQKKISKNLFEKVKSEVIGVVEITQDYAFHDRYKIINENKKNPIRHAYYHEYRLLQRLCLMILNEDKHQIGYGNQQLQGILFDCAWLWEEYIYTLTSDLFYHPRNKTREGGQWLFAKAAGKVGHIYPDFLGRDTSIIGDAKYKPAENIKNADYFQVLAYMFRFEAKIGFYFYPEKSESENQKFFLNTGSTYTNKVEASKEYSVIKLGLKIPQSAKSYEEFSSLMKKSEEDFISNITKSITKSG